MILHRAKRMLGVLSLSIRRGSPKSQPVGAMWTDRPDRYLLAVSACSIALAKPLLQIRCSRTFAPLSLPALGLGGRPSPMFRANRGARGRAPGGANGRPINDASPVSFSLSGPARFSNLAPVLDLLMPRASVSRGAAEDRGLDRGICGRQGESPEAEISGRGWSSLAAARQQP